MRRTTGKAFRVYPGGVIFQMQEPYHTLFLPLQASRDWMSYEENGAMEPLEFEIAFELQKATINSAALHSF